LEAVVIPPGVTEIADDTFNSCSSLTTVQIPQTVTSIGDCAFYFCTSLIQVVIPPGVTTIGEQSFQNCSDLQDIVMANSVTSIGDAAFAVCSFLTGVNLSSGLTAIADSTFTGCFRLTEIAIPAGVTSIGDSAFAYCSSMEICLFYGDAPVSIASNAFLDVGTITESGFTYYYLPFNDGFTTPEWNGYPCFPLDGIGKVVNHRGEVSVIRNGNPPVSLNLRDTVYEGDEIITGSRSFVQISFNDGVKLNIGPKSRLVLEIFNSQQSTIRLRRGIIIRGYKPTGSKLLHLSTKNGAFGVRGTTFAFEAAVDQGILTTTATVLVGLADFEDLTTGEIAELQSGDSASSQSLLPTRSLTINHISPSLGRLILNDEEITNFPHVATYEEGAELLIDALPEFGFFAGWSGDLDSFHFAQTFYLDEDMAITANFLDGTEFVIEHPTLNPNNDDNRNGISNFLEYASGQAPDSENTLPIIEYAKDHLTVRQRINGWDAYPEIQYSGNLTDWFPLDFLEEGTDYTVVSRTVDGEMLTLVMEFLSNDEAQNRFFRQLF